MNAFIIIANGPFLATAIIQEAIQGRCIVALDGAADRLLPLNIRPDVILGDFDSIHSKTQDYWGIKHTFATMTEHDKPYQGHHGVTIVPTKDQSETDLLKAIRYCDQHDAQDISIICATGGREDHHEASKLALQIAYRADRPIHLHGEQQTLRWAENETINLHGEAGDHCGFVAQKPGVGHAVGLLYPCDAVPVSLCNRLQNCPAQLTIEGAALIIMPPQLSSQRQALREAEALLVQLIL